MTPTAMAAALSTYRRRCLLCRQRDAIHVVTGGPEHAPAVCSECVQDMPVEMVEVKP